MFNPLLRGSLMTQDPPAPPPYDPLEDPNPQSGGGGSDGPILPAPDPNPAPMPPPPPGGTSPHDPPIIILN